MDKWDECRLDDLCTIKGRIGYRGYTKNDLVPKGQGAISLSPSNIINNKLCFDDNTYLTWAKYNESPEIMLEVGDIVYCKTASIGKLAFVETLPEKTTLNPQLVVLKNIRCNNRFLYYYMASSDFSYNVADMIVGTAVPTLSQKKLGAILIPLPPLAEQQRIVAKLDSLFARIEKLKASMERIPQLLKDFRQAVLTQAVTGKLTEEWREGRELEEWREVTLGEIIEGTPKNGAYYPKHLYGNGTRIIRIDAFYDGKLKDWDLVQSVSIPDSDKETYGLKEGDILINRVNSIEYLGKCMLVQDLPEECIFESNMMRMSLNRDYASPEYIRTFLTSPVGLKELRKNAKHAVNQASINQKDVSSVEVNLPGNIEQQEIVRRVESLFAKADRLEAQYQNLKKDIEQLPHALLAKAFRGELVEQLPTDGDARELLAEIQRLKGATVPTGKGRKKSLKVDDGSLAAEPKERYGK